MTMHGRRPAAQALVEGRERFLAFVRSRVSDPDLAEDILQDSLLKALKAAPDLRQEDRLTSWFFSVLRNSIADAYRRRVREPAHIDLEHFDMPAESEEDVAKACECFRTILPTLNPGYASLIEEIDLNGVDSSKVAAAAGITANNLKVRHHRARRALRQRLEETCRVCAEHHCLDCTCKSGDAV
jgi:RNA polymerase sigma-70 factor (ECF subfamily)